MSLGVAETLDTCKSLTICSKDLINGVYYLPVPIYAKGVRVESAFFCNVLQNVPYDSAMLFAVRDTPEDALPIVYNVPIPAGNYSAYEFVAHIQAELDS